MRKQWRRLLPEAVFSRRLRRFTLGMAAFSAAVTLLAGCMQAEIAVRVEDNGSGTASVLFAFDRSLLELLGSLDEEGDSTTEEFDPASVFEGLDESELPPGSTVEPYEQGDYIGARVTAPFERVEDVPALLDEITGGLVLPGEDPATSTGTDSGFERFAIERTEDGWRFDAVMEPASLDEPGAEDDELTASLLEDASFAIKVALPGAVQEHNADVEDGGELTWTLDLMSTESRTMSARTSTTGEGAPWLLLLGGGAGVLGLGAVAWDVRRRRRGAIATPEPEPAV